MQHKKQLATSAPHPEIACCIPLECNAIVGVARYSDSMLRTVTLSLLLALVVALSGTAWAQSDITGATLNGTVQDPSGAPVPNVKVTATSPATGTVRVSTTNDAGLYSLRLPAGPYDISVEAQGFKTARKQGVSLNIGSVSTFDVKLEIGQAQETVSVTDELPLVESSRSQTSTVVDSKAVAELPVNGRNFLDFTLLTPGVSRDLTRGGDISFGGQRGTANSLLVDGSDSNNVFFGQSTGRAGTGRNPYTFSQDAVQEFQVNTNGYAAEIGRAGGGVINVITKSGTNLLHGTLFEFFRNEKLNANTWANNRRNAARRIYRFNQFGGNLGGPIKKDKLFFFFDYDGQRNTLPNPVFLAVPAPADDLSQQAFRELQPKLNSYSNKLDNNVYLGKVDWNISNSHRLTTRYNANRFVGKNFENTGTASAQEHTGDSAVTTDNVAGTHTWVMNSAAVVESRMNYTRDNQPGQANSTQPEAQIRQAGTLVMQIGRNSFSPRYTNAKTFQLAQNLSYLKGAHSFKMGYDIITQRIGNFFPGNFGGSFQFNSYADFAARRAASFTQGFAGEGTAGALTQPNSNEIAFFAQDSWRVTNRLTLNYGMRYDVFTLANPPVRNPLIGFDNTKINRDTNNLAGRFGFAYKLSDKMVIRGGAGMFYGRTPAILLGTAHSQNGIQVQTYTLTANIPVYPNVLAAPPTVSRTPDIYVFDPKYVQPLTHQFNLNIERQLGRDYSVTLGYLGVRGIHLTRTRDINLFPAESTAATFADGTATRFLRYPTARPNPNFRRISLFDSGADSIYHGGFVQLTKRFSKGFQIQSSYTFSKVIDTVPDQTSVVVGGGDDGKVPQYTTVPGLDRALGNSDVRSRFVVSGVWDINYSKNVFLRGYQLSMITTAQTGRYFSATIGGNSDVNNDGNTRTDRPPFQGRNIYRAPNFAAVDLRFSRDINLKKDSRAKLKLVFEAFNLTNRANFTSFLTTPYNFNSTTRVFTPVATFGQVTDTADPRIAQIALKITF